MITSDKPIEIPKVWKDLLALDSIPESSPRASVIGCETENPKVDDPLPYRDDRREVSLNVGGLTVIAFLISGDNNYWLDWEVWDEVDLLTDTENDPDYDIPEVATLEIPNGETIEVPVKLV